MEVSKQCKECVKFIHEGCKGKPDKKEASYFGTKKSGRKTGLNFCKLYEFDESCYPKKNDAFIVENTGTIKARQKVRKVEKENKQHSDEVDLGANLSSADFEDLMV